jgi:hypothetical protein
VDLSLALCLSSSYCKDLQCIATAGSQILAVYFFRVVREIRQISRVSDRWCGRIKRISYCLFERDGDLQVLLLWLCPATWLRVEI